MILLESENIIIRDVLTDKFARPSSVDQTFTDFDGVAYHIESTKQGPITLSMDIRCWSDLAKTGALDIIKREYGDWVRPETEPDYSITLEFDYAKVPPLGAERDALIQSCSLLKRNAMAAPFERAFSLQKELEAEVEGKATAPAGATDIMPIHYRDDEAIYVIPAADRVTVVFSTIFKEETDRIIGKVFLQEFVDARRQPSIQNAPQVLYTNREPPLEIRSVPGLKRGEDVGYVTFVLFPRHFQHPEVMARSISHIQLFIDYLHYHIKCSKAYLHSRMRHRVAEFLKVLNRAKPEQAEKERKTASGRTFRRA
ncbi:putative ARC35-subunit of the Arp2/3 complex [Violaceomyces palustris]|uniref:ARC35-subunit of the Arp2/3 complex n=1 Tax=Violaceomyces palustris TaxID=1673888 RepID=A0ACD0NY97_9BASI|nr:putative ARC35-subunit of the Arp2/3 complex [Violaceomyces palustris]